MCRHFYSGSSKILKLKLLAAVTPLLFAYSSVYEPGLERVDGVLSMHPILALD